MKIGVPKEIKNNENRVALTPPFVKILVEKSHDVVVQSQAGVGAGFEDTAYEEMGATIVQNPEDAWDVDMVLKVKEPLASEYHLFKPNQILFTYLHLAPNKELTDALLEKKVTSIAYESVRLADGSLPLLTPMSEIAGRMAPQTGAYFLESINEGAGVLLSAVPGVEKGQVVIIGGGVAGTNAAKLAVGLGAKVRVLDVNPKRLAELEDIFGNNVETVISNSHNIEKSVKIADLVIGAVLIPGRKAPRLVTEDMVKQMKPGSVIIDIAIDQGGIFETTDHVTNHDNPTYIKHGVVHYAVANMPGAVARTSTLALTNNTLPYIVKLANDSLKDIVYNDEALRHGFNTYNGVLNSKEVAEDQNRLTDYKPIIEVL
ncbi:alanine dehydrogenase [Vagococcus sp. JNUCC 83]